MQRIQKLKKLIPMKKELKVIDKEPFLESLFTNHYISLPTIQQDTITTTRALTRIKLQESVSTIYAYLKNHQFDKAERLFYTIWRTNPSVRPDVQSIVETFVIELVHYQKTTSTTSYDSQLLDWFTFLDDAQEKPTPTTIATMLDYFIQGGKIGDAKSMIEKYFKDEDGFDSVINLSEESEVLRTLAKSMGIHVQSIPTEMDEHNDQLLLGVLQDSLKEKETMPKVKTWSIKDMDTEGVKILRELVLSKLNFSKDAFDGSKGNSLDPYHLQMQIEAKSLQAAQAQLSEYASGMPKGLLENWYKDFVTRLDQVLSKGEKALSEQKEIELFRCIRPFLALFKPSQLARLVISEIVKEASQNRDGYISALALAQNLASTLQKEHNLENLVKGLKSNSASGKYAAKKANLSKQIHELHQGGKLFHLKLRNAISDMTKKMESNDRWKPEWGDSISVQVGTWLLTEAMNACKMEVVEKVNCRDTETVDSPRMFKKAKVSIMSHTRIWKNNKQVGVYKFNSAFNDLLSESLKYAVQPWSLPMVVKPLPWLSVHSGGYITQRFPLVRTNGNAEHMEMIKEADQVGHLSTVMRSLDVLGSTAWRINPGVLKVATHFWNEELPVKCIPSTKEMPPPPVEPVPPKIPSHLEEVIEKLGLVHGKKNKKVSSEEEEQNNIKIAQEKSEDPEFQAYKAEFEEFQTKYRVYKNEHQKHQRAVFNIFSERCSANYKLDIASAFLGQRIYFPHNVDFRGRAYPLPPHLNHIGDDLSRGLLLFDDAKPLGPRGLYWLRIHISNLFGYDKASLQDRHDFTNTHLDDILDSAEKPIDGRRWWLTGDSPWQLLAACQELAAALKLPNPEDYKSRIPVHQDGSCNGLQHYAALGGDLLGARAVNLVPSDTPADVYMQVANLVQQKVDAHVAIAKQDPANGKPEALLMQKRINRKLVKQTVMTNTYGVTRIGARDQILSRLREARPSEPVEERLSDDEIKKCASYITGLVFESMGDMFTGARAIQVWLNTVARLVTSSVPKERIPRKDLMLYRALVETGALKPEDRHSIFGFNPEEKIAEEPIEDGVDAIMHAIQADVADVQKDVVGDGVSDPLNIAEDDDLTEKEFVKLKKGPLKITSMTWTTPLGFPIIQPYRRSSTTTVQTHLQTFTIRESSQASPVNPMKQSSAFPPNFVHSLDASHMMLTSLSCHTKGLVFAAVHDSYWTHACDIDEMSELLREAFVRLHSKNIISRLEEELYARFDSHFVQVSIEVTQEKWKKVCEKLGKKLRYRKLVPVWVPFIVPPTPRKGEFEVSQVKNSPYFFH